jgi:hypothetical protein
MSRSCEGVACPDPGIPTVPSMPGGGIDRGISGHRLPAWPLTTEPERIKYLNETLWYLLTNNGVMSTQTTILLENIVPGSPKTC